MAIKNTYAAESWDKVYTAFEQINFTSYDYDTIKASLIQYLKTYYPEQFNDFIESSELIAVLELFAYIAELLAYRVDVMSHENFITTAQRKQSILKLAKLISYKAARNIPARGLAKISSVKTSEEVFDSLGNNLANTTVFWNDTNNSNWKEQFFLVFNKILTSKFGQPSKSFQIGDVLMQLYTFKNDVNSFRNGVFSFSTNNTSEQLLLEAVPADIDENGPLERAPDTNAQFNLIYSVDGRGDGSDFTGFLLFLKQGNLLRTDYLISEQASNRRIELDVENVNNTDVWVYRVDENSTIIEKWEQIETLNEQNLYFNDVSSTRKKFEVETLENDRIALHFGDGDLSDSPVGSFQLWCRTSVNRDITIPKNSVVNQQMQFLYTNSQNSVHQAFITFSLTASMQNNSTSETAEHIRQSAPSTYYAQNRMVNAQDYNTYMLKDTSILRLKTINRTFAGQPKHLEWNDASRRYENVKLFGDDLSMFIDTNVEYTETSLNTQAVIDSVLEKILSSRNFLSALTHVYSNTQKTLGIVTYPRRKFINSVDIGVTEINDITIAMDGNDQAAPLQYFGLKFNPIRLGHGNGTIELYDKNDEKEIALQSWRKNNSISAMGLDSYDDSCPAEGIDFYDDRTETLTLEMTGDGITFSVISNLRGNLPNYKLVGTRWTQQISSPLPVDFKINAGNVDFIEGDSFIIDIKKYTESQIQSYGPRWGANVRTLNDDNTNRCVNVTGKWEVLTSSMLDNEDYNLQNGPSSATSIIEFDPEDEVSSWMFILKNIGTVNQSKWSIWSRDVKIIVESKNTKFWYNQSDQILDFETKKPVIDKIRVLKSNLDSLGKPLIKAHLYDVIGSVFNRDGSINFNRVQVIPSASSETSVGSNTINANIMQFEEFSVGSYEYFIINEQTGLVERYLDDCDSYEYSGYDVGLYDVGSYDSGGIVVMSGPGAGSYDFLTNKFISDQVNNIDNIENVQYRLGRRKKVPALRTPFSQECNVDAGLDFMWQHFTPMHNMIDPSTTNINDMFILTNGYYTAVQNYINGNLSFEPEPPSSVELRTSYGSLLKAKMISDTVVLHSGKIKLLFGSKAQQKLRAKFRVVKSPTSSFSDERIKQEILSVINSYFDIKNWDFGQKFYATELIGLIHQRLSTHILSVVLVPMDPNSNFGSLFTIDSGFDEILQSAATITDIEMISDITPQAIRQK
jgi:hypothetical protein